jgi:hypothetical protein
MFNLSFLNASILAFAAATVIPLLIHLFARRRPKRLVFSSIRFIKQSVKQRNRKLNLLQLLLLILRMMTILCLVLAVARPVVKAPFLKSGVKHARTAVAIVLDTSYSMDYLIDTRTDLEIGKEMIAQIDKLLTPDDMSALLTLNAGWNRINARLQMGGVPAKLIQSVRIAPQAADLKSVLEEADRILADSQLPNREIYLITDGQRQNLPAKTEAPVFVIHTSELPDKLNQSIADVRAAHDLVDPKGGWRVDFNVVNHSRATATDVICQLVVDNVARGEKVVSLTPGQTAAESFPVDFDGPGWHSGYVEVKNERLLFDNKGWFAANYDPAPKIAVLTDASELPATLSALTGMFAGAGSVTVLRDTPGFGDMSQYAALVIYGKRYDGQTRFLLDKMQSAGMGFLFVADKDLSPEWKNWAQSALGLTLSEYREKKAAIDGVNRFHPITAMLNPDALRRSSVTGYWGARMSGGESEVLLEASGSPVAVARNRSVAWLFDPADLHSSFLLDTAYPVFAWRCLETASAGAGAQVSLTVGDRVILNGRMLETPDGAPLETSLPACPVTEPGIYSLTENGEKRPFAVNLDDTEGDFLKMDPTTAKLLRRTSKNWLGEILVTRFGFETWKFFLILALLCLAGEMLLVKHLEKSGE